VKTLACILAFYLSGLTISPVALMLYSALKPQCEMQCSMEEKESCDMSDMECCPAMCNPAQCCFCCFVCTVDQKRPEIKIFQTNINPTLSEKQYALSDFVSDCWQPPETV
jgi:hypothetical protein